MPLLTTFNEVLTATLLFLTLWSVLHIYIRAHGPFPLARRLMRLHNHIQVLLSLTLVLANLLCHCPSPRLLAPVQTPLRARSCHLPRTLYHLSKLYEYVDILLVVAQGGDVGLHFAFHHVSTPWYTYARVLRDSEGWGVFAGANAVHHALMYGYFAGAEWTKSLLTYTQNIQLIAGILCDLGIVMGLVGSGGAKGGNWVSMGLLSCYFVLHRRDVLMEEKGPQNVKKEE